MVGLMSTIEITAGEKNSKGNGKSFIWPSHNIKYLHSREHAAQVCAFRLTLQNISAFL